MYCKRRFSPSMFFSSNNPMHLVLDHLKNVRIWKLLAKLTILFEGEERLFGEKPKVRKSHETVPLKDIESMQNKNQA